MGNSRTAIPASILGVNRGVGANRAASSLTSRVNHVFLCFVNMPPWSCPRGQSSNLHLIPSTTMITGLVRPLS